MLWLTAALLLLALTVACQAATPATVPVPSPTVAPLPTATPLPAGQSLLGIRKANGERVQVRIETAETPDQRTIGLSGRQQLDPDAGMLFIFEQAGRYDFWMRGTFVPLSIAFADEEGTIVDIQDMAPLTDDRHAPEGRFLYALEVNRGFFERHGVKAGDRVELPRR